MRALRSFTVRPTLPEALDPLYELAHNLRWSWDNRTRQLFQALEPEAWRASGRDPARLLGMVRRERLDALVADPDFRIELREAQERLRHYLGEEHWFQGRTSPLRGVAYFSPEFGIAEGLPQYSGGLGVLAGDHLKAASDLGVPIVGIGLLYRQGYFRQELSDEGWQHERYMELDPHAMALEPVEGARVHVDMAGTPLQAIVWRAQVGRVRLYLLDTDVDENEPGCRQITDRLYGGDTEHRLRQEILLGVGGVRLLDAVGEQAQVFHTNEGHAGFQGLERIRRAMVDDGMAFAEALEAVRSATLFTTHTPVPAGIDKFPRELMERYFKGWTEECNVDFDTLTALGREPGDNDDGLFNMAYLGLRLAARANGVSRLHGEVSRRMFAGLWPGVPVEEVPITSVTNGVHGPTWVADEMADLLDRHVGRGWNRAGDDRWAGIDEATDHELWSVRQQGRQRLVAFVRRRLREAELARGASEADVVWCDSVLDPEALTIGFARRMATYKRATLLLSQPDRLRALLQSSDRPVQLVFAGKSHPADEQGKQMVRQLVQFSRQADVRARMVFLDDYDIEVARFLYQGSDVWLNNPRRPLEACGTSGQKAALNGGLNCSIRDGWWDEMYDGDNGWAIPSAESYEDLAWRDEVEGGSLFDVLEQHVVPLFYERESGLPVRWLRRVRASLRSLGPRVTASRMVEEYVEELYEPIAAHADALTWESGARARVLAEWKARVRKAWPAVHVASVDSDTAAADLGAARSVAAVVGLAGLSPDDVAVELLHGTVGPGDEIHTPAVTTMELAGPGDDGQYRYEGHLALDQAGRYGFTVRVVPAHADLESFADLGCITWA